MLKLYYSPGACAMASHIALEEAGADYELVKIDLRQGQQKTPEYLAVNPAGVTPAFVKDEGVLTEERPGIFNLKTVVRQYVAYKTGGTKDDQSRLAAARADREETRGKIEKMKMEEAKGNLHRTEDIEKGLKTAFANFKDRLEAIPTKYADTMAS